MAGKVDIGGAFKAGWANVMKNPTAMIGGFVVVGVVMVVINLLVKIPVVGLLVPIISMVANFFLFSNYYDMAFRVVNDQPAEIGDLFKPHPQLANFAATSFIMGIAIAIGSIFLVIPGLIAAVLLGFAPLLVIDRGMSPMDALKASVDLAKPHMMSLIGFGIAAFVVNFIGMLCLGVGMLVTAPMTFMAVIQIYRSLAGAGARRGTGRMQGAV